MWKISKRIDLTGVEKLSNITHLLAPEDLAHIGRRVWEGYTRDRQSRAKWEKRTQAAMDLAMQIQKQKSFPWPGCANVCFPLVSIACLQFHSRAYPSLISGTDIVKYRVVGKDPQGTERDRATRIGRHMSYQVLEEDQAWEEQHDRLFLSVPIVGCAFVKTFYDPDHGGNVSELVLAQDLVMNYYAKSVEQCPRKTQIYPITRNELYTGSETERFRDVRECEWYTRPAVPLDPQPGTSRADTRKGQTPPMQPDEDTPYTALEQHCRFDLDGDGYAEPWIVTIEAQSKEVIRIVAGWDDVSQVERSLSGGIARIHSTEYYTKYGFIPSADGGVYDVGFGVLLGPLNSAVNAVINQLLDAGTLNTTRGGFLARGAKIRGGQYQFTQFGWNRVDATGDDLRKSIFPMPTQEPSPVLFQLLGFIIQYAQRLGASTDALVGENPGQNTPAATQQSMVEQGMKIYSALFKRQWRSMKEEFRKLYCLNATYLPDTHEFGDEGQILRQDYMSDSKRICPVADPNIVSDEAQVRRAMTIKQLAATTPGYALPEVEKQVLRALHVEEIDTIYPGPNKVPPLPNPKLLAEQAKGQAQAQVATIRGQMELRKFAMQMMETHRLNTAKIMQLEAQAAQLMEQAGGVQTGHDIAAFNAAIAAYKTHNEALTGQVDQILKALELQHAHQQDTLAGGMGGMGTTPGNAGPQGGAAGEGGGPAGAMG